MSTMRRKPSSFPPTSWLTPRVFGPPYRNGSTDWDTMYPMKKSSMLTLAMRRVSTRHQNHVADWRVIGITTRPPHNPRAAGLWEVENGQWMCSLIGTAGHYPPSDEEGFLDFARGLPDPRIHAFIRDAKPLDENPCIPRNQKPLAPLRRDEALSLRPGGVGHNHVQLQSTLWSRHDRGR